MNALNGDGRLAGQIHLQEVVRSAQAELLELRVRRAEIMRRIATLKQTLAGLADLFGDQQLPEDLLVLLNRRVVRRQRGLTRACRMVLKTSVEPLGARQICDHLQSRFPELIGHHKDPVASTATVLARLVEYAEARCFVNPSGHRVWEWVAEMTTEKTLPDRDIQKGEAHSCVKSV